MRLKDSKNWVDKPKILYENSTSKRFPFIFLFYNNGKKKKSLLKKKRTRKVNTACKWNPVEESLIPDHRTYRTYAYYNGMVFNTEYWVIRNITGCSFWIQILLWLFQLFFEMNPLLLKQTDRSEVADFDKSCFITCDKLLSDKVHFVLSQ